VINIYEFVSPIVCVCGKWLVICRNYTFIIGNVERKNLRQIRSGGRRLYNCGTPPHHKWATIANDIDAPRAYCALISRVLSAEKSKSRRPYDTRATATNIYLTGIGIYDKKREKITTRARSDYESPARWISRRNKVYTKR